MWRGFLILVGIISFYLSLPFLNAHLLRFYLVHFKEVILIKNSSHSVSSSRLGKRIISRNYVLIIFSLVLAFSPFSSLGGVIFAQTKEADVKNQLLEEVDDQENHSKIETQVSEDDFSVIPIGNGEGALMGYSGSETSLIIPEVIQGLTIVSVGQGALKELGLVFIEFPDTITGFGASALEDNDLTYVAIPENVTVIHDRAFANNNIDSVQIHSLNIDIADAAFDDNKSRPEYLTMQAYYASNVRDYAVSKGFSYRNFETVVMDYIPAEDLIVPFGTVAEDLALPSKVEVEVLYRDQIETRELEVNWDLDNYNRLAPGDYTIEGELELTNFINPHEVTPYVKLTVEDIPQDSDYVVEENDLGGLTIIKYRGNDVDLVIPEVLYGKTVNIIGENAFYEAGLRSVELPDTLEEIHYRAFMGNLLSEIVFPDSLKRLDNLSFADNHISEVFIPENTSQIMGGIFPFNPLETISVHSDNPVYEDDDGLSLYEVDGDDLIVYQGTESGVFPEGVTLLEFASYAALGIKGDLYIPDTVQTIEMAALASGNSMFYKNELDYVEIPGSVEWIEEIAFKHSSIKEVKLHEGIKGIGEAAFSFNQLREIELPRTVLEIDGGAFYSNYIEYALIRNKNISLKPDVFEQNQLHPENLLIRGYVESDVPAFAQQYNYNFKPYGAVIVDENDPHRFYPEEMVEIYNEEWDLEGVLYVPDFIDHPKEPANSHITVSSVDPIVATGLEVAGAVFDFEFTTIDDAGTVGDFDLEGDHTLSLLVNDDAPEEISMYHEEGHDEWSDVGGDREGNFITAVIDDFSVYGVFAIEEEDPEEPEEPEDPTDPEEPEDPEDPTDPEEPEDPEDPTDPEEPEDPEDPTDPEEPEDPEDPTDPEEPEDPEDPTDPEEPEDPEDPTDPEEPEDPEDPTDPEEPKDPEDPTDPEEPEDPEDPIDPEDLEDPEVPTDPEEPKDQEDPIDPEDSEDDGEVLPKTATNMFNFLLIGGVLVGLGTIIFIVRRRNSVI